MKKPNFFIIGAPKCGTTSLASWLSDHPEVYMSPIKEPDYFHTNQKIRSLEEYETLFAKATDEHKAVGEASVRYLYSNIAVPSILAYSSTELNFIVMLRNPIEMAPSLHWQRVYSLNETEISFEKAWALQNDDKSPRKDLPKDCYTPEINNYGPVCKVGEQLERLFEMVNRRSCKLILLEDMKLNPRQTWLDLMEFLEISDDGRNIFEAENKAKTVRSRLLKKTLRKIGQLKERTGFERNLGVLKSLSYFNKVDKPRPPISSSMREELRDYFKEDIQKIESILNRDLSHWK